MYMYTILVSYIDIFFGFPIRFVFGFINDRVRGVREGVVGTPLTEGGCG